ncbi:argininosuccinate lyase [Dissulfurirhabdus thermomarina]|uniref:Argininosuccinate lyase n=1 Tax=Dissulfurirhabdus thermomarina TaxID=1765737 RepID=A0A6N9TN71_DISTH|nr:argininosuccinate lyase [Dissulfurirhabdus thermomarina]NDY42752.1 argininosuccinate lyase [Dissulfurirhabdus thermomarina]NMX22606.1 argininosuccinate lyase [Dissulfurirhabdus thermomarina]
MADKDAKTAKPWGGRFREATHRSVERFTQSVHYDRRLARHDIAGSRAHARMLARVGVISEAEAAAIVRGLDEILAEIEAETFQWRPDLEDVHMNIERALAERIGEPGKKLHTGRSRNDQVATDVRLFLREEIDRLDGLLHDLQSALVAQAEAHPGLVLPGYTHLQRAQPVLWAHHMLAYFEMFKRDRGRLADCRRRVNLCPLGSAALAGTGFPLDRESVARELGFDGITANSLDAVGDRDFVVEFEAAAALVMAHLSRLSEELVLWASAEFGFVELPDGFCTGSSIMPQKKNPDVPELVRGKTGRVIGHLAGTLAVLKGLPLAYNRDLQEDKEALFDVVDTVADSVEVMAGLVARLAPREDRMRAALRGGFLTATDLADYLVGKGLPFREAHEVVGRAVAACLDQGRELADLSLEELRGLSPAVDEDVFEVLTPEGSVAARRTPGGTAPDRVAEALAEARAWLGRRG